MYSKQKITLQENKYIKENLHLLHLFLLDSNLNKLVWDLCLYGILFQPRLKQDKIRTPSPNQRIVSLNLNLIFLRGDGGCHVIRSKYVHINFLLAASFPSCLSLNVDVQPSGIYPINVVQFKKSYLLNR